MKISYADKTTPKEYVCSQCKATNCKLWREYQTSHPSLFCAHCAVATNPKLSNVELDPNGTRHSDYDYANHGMRTDQLGWYVPAIPDEEGVGYWGYASIPPNGAYWWRQLSTYPFPWNDWDEDFGTYGCWGCGVVASWRTHAVECEYAKKSWWKKLKEMVA